MEGAEGSAVYIRLMEIGAGVVDLAGWRPAEEEVLGARDKDWMAVAAVGSPLPKHDSP
ncbi:MAG: hypothetical protein ACYC3K_01880 [Candidatus Nanopelagicales bacterium]